jgi:TolB protein
MGKFCTSLFVLLLGLPVSGFAQDAAVPRNSILYVSNASGSWQIYRIRPDGTGAEQLTNLAPTSFDLWAPNYSADRKKIAFCYGVLDSSGNGPLDVYVMDADGSNVTQITHDGVSCIPRWSPDGSHLVFAHIADTGVGVIYVMRSDGSHRRELTSKYWDSFGGRYTPDGKHIVFYSENGGYVAAVWIMNADGSHQRRLTAPALEAFPWDVSSDGRRIALFSHVNTPYPDSLYTVGVDGSGLHRLTNVKNVHDLYPTFSPDGSHIAFASDRESTDSSLDLFVMRADGTHVHRIADGLTVGGCADGNCVVPDW